MLEEHLDIARVFGVGMLETRLLGVGVLRVGLWETKRPGISPRTMNLNLESRHLVAYSLDSIDKK